MILLGIEKGSHNSETWLGTKSNMLLVMVNPSQRRDYWYLTGVLIKEHGFRVVYESGIWMQNLLWLLKIRNDFALMPDLMLWLQVLGLFV